MTYIYRVTSVLLLFAFAGTTSAVAADKTFEAMLRDVMEKQTAAYNREDDRGMLSYIHTKSPEYTDTQQVLPGQFGALDVRAEVVDFRYLGRDDEFAVARVKMKTAGQPGAGFGANILDTIVVFHQEDGAWKLWSDQILGVELVQ